MGPSRAKENRVSNGGNFSEDFERPSKPIEVAEGLMVAAMVVVAIAFTVNYFQNAGARPETTVVPGVGRNESADFQVEGMTEAENLVVSRKSRDFGYGLQGTRGFSDGMWSRHGHMFGYQTQKDDWIDYELPVANSGKYKIEVFLTKARDYGIVQFSVNGRAIEKTFDLYDSNQIVATGAIDLGTFALKTPKNVFRMQIVGKNENAAAPFYQFGIDGVRVTPEAALSKNKPKTH